MQLTEIIALAAGIIAVGIAIMAYQRSGQPGRFEGLRCYVQAKVDSGPVSGDDMRVAVEMWDRGAWDWETAVSATGVDDVDAVKSRLEKERGAQGVTTPQGLDQMEEALARKGLPVVSTNGTGDEAAPENISSTEGLNGIQIRAAIELLEKVNRGELAPSIAVELLISLGIDRARAQAMVDEAEKFVAANRGQAQSNGQVA